ncbi:hypothetical protein [Shewanella sp. GXUN23E]|uniref:hypothetical protein n=1 Tax=Shewanella sp. GXUN23E TaxID=3422498 RepID=UPI003D7E65D9
MLTRGWAALKCEAGEKSLMTCSHARYHRTGYRYHDRYQVDLFEVESSHIDGMEYQCLLAGKAMESASAARADE